MDPDRQATQRTSVLSCAQAEALFAACPDANARRYVALALFAGLRRVEIESLQWSDLLANDYIRVRAAKNGASRLV